jgi:ribonuclease HI
VQDELADDSDPGLTVYLQPTSQLLAIGTRLKELVENWNIEKIRANWETPWNTGPEATITISSSRKPEAVKEHNRLLESIFPAQTTPENNLANTTLAVYTDGSQGHGGSNKLQNGAGICLLGPEGIMEACCWNLGTEIEVADAEVVAVIKALETAQQHKPAHFFIFSDSQAAIERLKNGTDFYTQRARALIKALARKTTIEVHWVPSHSGVIGNEIADQQAKAGLLKEALPEDLYTSISHLRRNAREDTIKTWKAYWAREEDRGLKAAGLGKHYRKVCGNPHFSLKPSIPELPRRLQSAYIQLKTGVGYLRAYQARIRPDMAMSIDYQCTRCNSRMNQTTRHLLLLCTAYKQERETMEAALEGLPLSLQTLFCTSKGKAALAGFLLETEICTAKWAQGAD